MEKRSEHLLIITSNFDNDIPEITLHTISVEGYFGSFHNVGISSLFTRRQLV